MLPMNWRDEIKYPCLCHPETLLFDLFNSGFSEIYPSRKVESIYLDSDDFHLLDLGRRDGYSRFHLRIRSYNQTNSQLELKLRNGNLSCKLKSSVPANFSTWQYPQEWNSLLEPRFRNFIPGFFCPKITISYQRFYLVNMRSPEVVVTLDTNLLCAPWPHSPDLSFSMGVLEVKSPLGSYPDLLLPPGLLPAGGHSKYRLACDLIFSSSHSAHNFQVG